MREGIVAISLANYLLIFCSFSGLQCDKEQQRGDISESGYDYVHIYKPNGEPFNPSNEKEYNAFETSVFIWVVVTSIVVFLIILICCFAFFKLSRKFSSTSHASRTDLIPPTNARQQHSHPSATREGTINRFMRQTSRPPDESEDMPPDYTEVVARNTVLSQLRVDHLHHTQIDKKIETPPPAYITVAPFK